LALRSELSFGHFGTGTGAFVSRQFGPTRAVPNCLGSELSGSPHDQMRSMRLSSLMLRSGFCENCAVYSDVCISDYELLNEPALILPT